MSKAADLAKYKLTSTLADANQGPVLELHRNSASPADEDNGPRIKFTGKNDAGQDVEYARLRFNIADVTDGTEDGTTDFAIMKNGSLVEAFRVNASEFVINEGANGGMNFRVEGDSNANCIFLDANDNITCFGTTNTALATQNTETGINLTALGRIFATTTDHHDFNMIDDGEIFRFRSATTEEGNISVSGSTISYNGFSGTHESSGIATNIAIGTVVSTIDELDVYAADGSPKAGQTRADHAKVKVSDSVGDKRVYGVVASFNHRDTPIIAAVGIGSVRVTGACAGGDLLESNGDGTAKVQSDDIIRSKTIGKVTIGNSSSSVKLVSCVLYCG